MSDFDHTARIFREALAVVPGQRADFLDSACGDDAGLRQEIESLLNHHEASTLSGLLLPEGVTELAPAQGRTKGPVQVVSATLAELFRGGARRTAAWLLAALFLAGIGYWTRESVLRALRDQVREQLRVVLLADTTALETWMAGRRQEAAIWANNPAVQDLTARFVRTAEQGASKPNALKASPLQNDFASLFQPFLAQSAAEGAAVVLIDRTGLRMAATHPFEWAIGEGNSEKGAAALVPVFAGQIKFVPPARGGSFGDRGAKTPAVITNTGAPVRGSSGEVIAALALVRSMDKAFSDILTVARMGTTGETYAISAEGLMLSPSRFDEMLKKAGVLPDRADASSMLNIEVRDPGGDLTRGYHPATELPALPLTKIASLAIASRDKPSSQQTGIVIEPYRDYRGIEVLGAWRWLPESDFGVITEVDASEAFTAERYVGRAFEVLFSLLSVFVVLTIAASVTVAQLDARKVRLGPYTLLGLIGEGGMSKVYLARHALLRRPAAVKVLKTPHRSTRQAIVRFEREVQAASGLTHPNTIQIYDFGRTPEGTCYYAMEYLPGINLSELVSLEGSICSERAVHILKQICGSLREAHECGVLHRDIKPLNIMLCERGGQCDFVKVVDFGLARQLDDQASLDVSAPGQLIGTPLYMAPERFSDPAASDPRSDIYSVGAVAYFLLAGRPVFQALNALDLQNQVVNAEPELPSRRVAHPIPARLERLIMDCLSKDPAMRPSGAGEILDVLESLAIPVWTRQQARDWWMRNLPAQLKNIG